jgi:hypothetical protein
MNTRLLSKIRPWRSSAPARGWTLILLAALFAQNGCEWHSTAEENISSLSDILKETLPWDKPGSGLVGNDGDVANIEFTGNRTIPAETLREALAASPGYLLGSHHLARREEFLAMLQRKVLLGYKCHGFPEPQVTVSRDENSGRVRVTIVEGRRFQCGEVRVSGVSPTLREALVARLTKAPAPMPGLEQVMQNGFDAAKKEEGFWLKTLNPPPSPQHPLTPNRKPRPDQFLWQVGQPGGFCEAARKDLELETREVLAEHGYFFSKINLHPELVPATGLADLVIDVTELGPPGEVSELEISGNQKNSESDLLQFLGFKRGMRVTRALLEEADQKLWQSGRFRHYELEPLPEQSAGASSTRIHLRVKVVEFERAPKLTEALSARGRALIRLGNWLSALAARPSEDVVFSLKWNDFPINLDLDVILSTTRGVLLQFKDSDFKARGYSYSCLMTTNTLGLFAPRRGTKLLGVNPHILVESFARLVPNPPGSELPFTLMLGGGWRYLPLSEAKALPPVRLDLTLAPAVFLNFEHQLKGEWKMEGNTCSIVTSNLVLKFDTVSGRLEEVRFDNGEVTASLRCVTNGFDGAVRSLEKTILSLTNQLLEGHLFGSFVGFVGSEVGRLKLLDQISTKLTALEREQAMGALCRLLEPAVFSPIEQAAKNRDNQEEKTFSIPADETDVAPSQNNLFAQCSGVVSKCCSEWFPRYSWPWTMGRESVLLLANQGTYVDAELNRLLSSDSTGPVGRLTLAAGLSRMNSPATQVVAASGLTHLRSADFRADCRLLFEGDSGLAKTVANMAEILRILPPSQLAALSKALPAPEGQLLKECAEAVRAQPKSPLAATLAPALTHYWEQSLHDRVRSKLLELAKRSPNRP